MFFSQGVSSTLDSDFEDWLRLIEFYREKLSELCFITYRHIGKDIRSFRGDLEDFLTECTVRGYNLNQIS